MPVSAHIVSATAAAVLEPAGVHTLDVGNAMAKVVAALSEKRADAGDVYCVMVYHKHSQPKPNVLSAAKVFFSAYKRALDSLANTDFLAVIKPEQEHPFGIVDDEALRVRFFWGKADAKALEERVKPSPGIYILTSHLDAHALHETGLPPLPKQVHGFPLVIQVKGVLESADDNADVFQASFNYDKFLESAIEENVLKESVARDTLEWRKAFIGAHPCWTSTQVAFESTSTAKNRAAIASRWVREKKIFAVKYEGQQWFPQFQFHVGEPVPAVAQVIQAFPEHTTGWDLAYFFATPNSSIAGRKPLELLKSDPARVVSLAQAFANPADAF